MLSRNVTGTNARRRSGRTTSGAMQDFRAQASAVKKDARHLAESAGTLASAELDPIRQYVAEKPVQSLLIAGGIGLLLGVLFIPRR